MILNIGLDNLREGSDQTKFRYVNKILKGIGSCSASYSSELYVKNVEVFSPINVFYVIMSFRYRSLNP